MSSKHPLLWAMIVSFCITAAAMPLLKLMALAFGITASRAGGKVPGTVPGLGGPAIVGGLLMAAAGPGMLPAWLARGGVFLVGSGRGRRWQVTTTRAEAGTRLN